MSHILFNTNIQTMFSVGDKESPGGWPAWADRECAILDRVATVSTQTTGGGKQELCSVKS